MLDVAIGNVEKARLVPDWAALGFAPQKESKGRGGKAAKAPKKQANPEPSAGGPNEAE